MFVKLRYNTVAAEVSEWSATLTVMCASVPNAPATPTLTLGTLDIIIVDWLPPADDGGSAVLGYTVLMKRVGEVSYETVYDGSEDPTTLQQSLTDFNGAILIPGDYQIIVIANNWVGEGAQSSFLVVTLPYLTSAELTTVSGNGITNDVEAAKPAEITLISYDTSGSRKPGGDFYFVHVTDYCLVTDNFRCDLSDDQDYVLFDEIIMLPMTDNNDGSYYVTYEVKRRGKITV